MDPVRILDDSGGWASRAALLAGGATRHGLREATLQGRVVRVHHGVYGVGMTDGVDALRAAAVSLRGVVSHDSAAVLWGLELAHVPGQHVTVPRDRSRARFDGVTVHRRSLFAPEVRQGVLVTDVASTVLDCARILPVEEAVVIADSALRWGRVTLDELRGIAARFRGPGAGRVRRVTALADPRCGSVLESMVRVLLTLGGVAPPRTQYVIRDEGLFVGRVDFAWPRHRLIAEVDGFEFHRGRDGYRRDRRRANAFCRLDWRLLRFTWEDVRLDPRYVLDLVRHELAKPSSRRISRKAA